jgi:type IV pilus assembly protein PilW
MTPTPSRFQRPRARPPAPTHCRGMTLIELMVAVAIGLVLVLTLLVLYLNIVRNQAQLASTGRQVENGKFALQILQEDLRHAGFWGDYLPRFDDKGLASPEDVPTALPAPCTAFSSPNWNTRNVMGIAVQGYNAVPTDCTTLLTNKASNTDVLLVRYLENCTVGQPNCDADTDTRLYFQSSRCTAETAAGNRFILNSLDLTAPPQFTLRSNIGCAVAAAATDTLAAKRRYVSRLYYVRNYSVTAGDGIPTLMRSNFDVNAGSPAYRPVEPLIDGIEGFRVEYGIDTLGANGLAVNYDTTAGAINRGDGTPDTYITCPKAGGVACNVDDMFHAVSARIHVLARNLEPTPGHTDSKAYVLAGVTYGPFNDGYMRRTYSTTVRLVNPASRREP